MGDTRLSSGASEKPQNSLQRFPDVLARSRERPHEMHQFLKSVLWPHTLQNPSLSGSGLPSLSKTEAS